MAGKDYQKTMQSMEEHESTWRELCRHAWDENDPVKFLEVTMQIMKFLARKQHRLDAAFDAAFDEAQELQKQTQQSRPKNTVN
jgi:hypothetical protein